MASFDPDRHRRQSIRAKGYDYSFPGMYFVTLCVQDRVCLFGSVIGDAVKLTTAGLMVESWWHDVASHFTHTAIDAYVVMPNHIHGIVVIEPSNESATSPENEEGRHAGLPSPPPP